MTNTPNIPTHNHVPGCRAVNFDLVTGAYTGTRASDPENCPTCADEQDA